MILPLFHSHRTNSTFSDSVSHARSRRHLQRSDLQSQHPNARMRLYDDLLLNGYYSTRLLIGTPAQTFALIVDTGSTVTYVPCSTYEDCGKHQSFNANNRSGSTGLVERKSLLSPVNRKVKTVYIFSKHRARSLKNKSFLGAIEKTWRKTMEGASKVFIEKQYNKHKRLINDVM